ncbi:alpha/beta-hydrolase [Trametopsis cervina]|nr:alpha/beta-hydrolase [Trametopsis cervina]
MPVYQTEPRRALYLLREALVTSFVRAPLWTLYALPNINRPRDSWSLGRTLRVRLMQYMPYVVAKTGPLKREANYLAIEQDKHVKGVWIAPVPNLILGEVKQWAADAGVESIRIPGYWFEKKGHHVPLGSPPKPGEKMLYVLHGGGFTRQSASPSDPTSNIPRGILEHTSSDVTRALTLEYRLTKHRSVKPYHPFPAALLDAIAGYNYLVNEVGFPPEDIIVEGDSAGGNLAIALVRYLLENSAEGSPIPRSPGALVLCSPWVDMGPASNDVRSSVQYNIRSDVISVANRGTTSLITNYCGALGREAGVRNRYISPASFSSSTEVSFRGFPRTLIFAGGAEVLVHSIRFLRLRMTSDIGSDMVTYVEKPDAVHDFMMFAWHEPERTECLRLIADWIESKARYDVVKSRL